MLPIVPPMSSMALFDTTSFTFMFVCVPEPVAVGLGEALPPPDTLLDWLEQALTLATREGAPVSEELAERVEEKLGQKVTYDDSDAKADAVDEGSAVKEDTELGLTLPEAEAVTEGGTRRRTTFVRR